MKRVVFINLHQNEFYVRHLSKMLFKQSSALKHRYFLDYLLCNPEIEVCNYISKYGTVLFNSVPKFVVWFQSLFRFLIYKLVIRKNGLSSKNITVIRHIKDIKSDDIVIGYRHIGCCLADMEMMHSFKIICMLHFNGETSDSNSIKKANPDILLNECDLRKYSDIFNKYYSWYKGDFIVHPFVASPRFQRTKPFFERENRCFSTGTITYKLHKEFLEVYKDSCDQPTRRQILANAKALEPWVACYNSDYLEDVEMKEYLPMDGKFTHYRKVWYNLTHAGRQKKYFSFNMVEKFNDFKMCLVGEEILGVPGIGFVEGMACGCAYIGQTVGYYEDYGMKEGVHYIGYDGSLDDLKKKISYFQQEEHQYELDRIATNGYVFAQKHFSSEKAANALLDSILQAQKKWLIKKDKNVIYGD